MKFNKKLPEGLSIPRWKDHHVSAIQALSRGGASETQQKTALEFIIHEVCLTYDMPYRPENQRDTDFLLGRMFAGQQIVKMLRINLSKMKEK